MRCVVLRQKQKLMQYNKYKLRSLDISEQEIASQIKKFEKNCLNLYNVINLEFEYVLALLLLQLIVKLLICIVKTNICFLVVFSLR